MHNHIFYTLLIIILVYLIVYYCTKNEDSFLSRHSKPMIISSIIGALLYWYLTSRNIPLSVKKLKPTESIEQFTQDYNDDIAGENMILSPPDF